MPEINDLILAKLRDYAPRVAEVAIEAIHLAETLPPRALEEQLEGLLRRVVRNEGVAQ